MSMIYQRRIPRDELFAAQLEMLMQNGRVSTVSMHLVGILAALSLFWAYLDFTTAMRAGDTSVSPMAAA